MSLGYTPVRGYIKSAFSFGEIVFVPDHKKKNKKTIKESKALANPDLQLST